MLCVRTAKHAGLEDRKGRLEVGLDADIVVWDPDAEIKVSAPARGIPRSVRWQLTRGLGAGHEGVAQLQEQAHAV